MKKAITAAFLFCLASSIANAQEQIELTKVMKCGKAQWVFNHFKDAYGETPTWVGKDSATGSYLTLLVNKQKRTWTMVQYDSGIACVLGAGEQQSEI